MAEPLDRRDFLKVASVAAGALVSSVETLAQAGKAAPAPRISAQPYSPIADYPIQAKRFSEVTMLDSFWAPKIRTNAEVTIPFEVEKLSERGLRGNVLEAAIYSLQTHPNDRLQAQVESRVAALKQAAQDRGNGGFEVAVAYFNATGKRDLLDPAIRTAAAIYDDFVANNPPFSGGERDAIDCLQLYRATRDRKHLDLAKHYLDIRGLENSVGRSRHNQSYKPVLEQSEAVGHAVNCVTLMVSMLDVGVLTGLRAYADAAQRMWADAALRKMYVTGGVGTTGNEGFGEPYSLPNISAYAETCAVLMYMTLNHRLFLNSGDSKYIDVLERGMYNNALSGIAASGDHFFYVNRLSSAGDGRDERWQRASLECCPPNLVRFLATMPQYIYAQKGDAIFVNLYVSSEATFKTAAGSNVKLNVQSGMPWGPKTAITVSAPEAARASIKLRIPGWARNQPVPGTLYAYGQKLDSATTISINGKPMAAVPDRLGYVTLDREWRNGDLIELAFPMEIRTVVADDRVKENRGKIAIERGPLVYCAEWPDCAGGKVLDLVVDPASLKREVDPQFFGGSVMITARTASITRPSAAAGHIRMIPYHLWANRGKGEMAVWLPTREYAIGDTGPAGGLIFHVNPNWEKDGWRYLEAAPFDQSAGASWGCFRQLIAGARGTAVGTGKQNTADMIATCKEDGAAAALCANLGLNGVAGWFLPSRDELVLMYKNLKATGADDFGVPGKVTDNFSYWASSQQTADMSVHVDFADLGRVHGDDKDFPRRVRAIRAF
jgi:uncharacterized protein